MLLTFDPCFVQYFFMQELWIIMFKSFTTCCDFSVMSMSAFTHGVIFVTEFETLAKGHLDTEDTTPM